MRSAERGTQQRQDATRGALAVLRGRGRAFATLALAAIAAASCQDRESEALAPPSAVAPADGRRWYLGEWWHRPADHNTKGGGARTVVSVFNPQQATAHLALQLLCSGGLVISRALAVSGGELAEITSDDDGRPVREGSCWAVADADRPVLPFLRVEEYSEDPLVPDALVAAGPWPAPLPPAGEWIFADGFQGGTESWYEEETLSVLNPGPGPANVRVSFHRRGGRAAPPADHELQVPAGDVRLLQLSTLRPRERTPAALPISLLGDYAVRLRADRPVVAQQTRRAQRPRRAGVIGARSGLGFPVGSGTHRLWYYAGGEVRPSPPPTHPWATTTWSLLFTHSLDARFSNRYHLVFHDEQGPVRQSWPLRVPPGVSDLRWLHARPFFGNYSTLGRPWAVTLKSAAAVVPLVSIAEFDPDAKATPGAMGVVSMHPGPLTTERTWWLGPMPIGRGADGAASWQATVFVFNPGTRSNTLSVSTFLAGADGKGPTTRTSIVLPAGAVRALDATQLASVGTNGQRATFRVEAETPVVVQATVRLLRMDSRPTRAMYSMLGFPLPLRDAR